MAAIRLFLQWENRLLAETLVEALAPRPGLALVGACDQIALAVPRLRRLDVDVVLLEGGAGPEVRQFQALREAVPQSPILAFGITSPEAAVHVLEAGASGYLSLGSGLEDFVRAIEGVHRGKPLCELEVAILAQERIHQLSNRLVPPQRRPAQTILTPRETEVLQRLARGLSNKEVARTLSIEAATVKNHVHNLVRKLHVRNRREAVRQAFDAGLLA